MKQCRAFLVLISVMAWGCGPSASELREKTISVLNVEADRWDGGKEFATKATDAYGQLLTCKVKKSTLNYVLEIRSNGPDRLPQNSDDIVVSRSKPHGETSIPAEAGKAAELISSGATSGVIKGIKKGLGLGKEDKK